MKRFIDDKETMVTAKTDDELAKQLWALGDVVRLRLLTYLPQEAKCESGMNVSQLAEKLQMSQPTVSHHLRVLRQAGIIEGTKLCRDVYYYVNIDEARAVLDALGLAFFEREQHIPAE